MVLEQFYLSCLAHSSYLVGSEGVAAVIDPQRDVDLYLEAARERGLRIIAVIETHLHADFVSGHRELAERTGAQIYIGRDSGVLFPHVPVGDRDTLQLGSLRLDFLSTPGHTLESICVLLTDASQGTTPHAVFTGDTLFIGDVGRPDLSEEKSAAELASMLYDSLFKKLLTLPDSVLVYPAHGAGSMCGRNIGSERFSTIGRQRAENYALRARSLEEFVSLVASELPPRPGYFADDVKLNRTGAAALRNLPLPPGLSPEDVEMFRGDGAVLLDTRPPADFGSGHIPGAWNISLGGQFASWAGTLVGVERSIVLVAADPDRVAESRVRLARVGIENVAGFLQGGVEGWVASGREVRTLPQVTVEELGSALEREAGVTVLDVRRLSEWRDGHIKGAIHIPLDRLQAEMATLDPRAHYAVHCKSGYRSSIACSILQARGFTAVTNVVGGFDAWTAAGFPVARDEAARSIQSTSVA